MAAQMLGHISAETSPITSLSRPTAAALRRSATNPTELLIVHAMARYYFIDFYGSA
jgi:hypothetical protein